MIVICFDVFDNKRRRKVTRLLLGYGTRVQYSVFECDITDAKLKQLQAKLAKVIAEQDKIVYFRLCPKDLGQRVALGRAEISKPVSCYYV